MHALVYLDESPERLVYPLEKGVLTIGRDQNATIRFDDDSVSTNHASITHEDGNYILRDQSTNGTYINGEKAENQILKHHDVIRVSQHLFLVELHVEASTVPASTPSPTPQLSPQPVVVTTPTSGSPHIASPTAVPRTVSASPKPIAQPSPQRKPVATAGPRPVSRVAAGNPSMASAALGPTRVFKPGELPLPGQTKDPGLKKEIAIIGGLLLAAIIIIFVAYKTLSNKDDSSEKQKSESALPGMTQ